MSSSREIRNKIKSVQNTQKITRAMELVAASKMRKARDRMEAARPYAQYARDIIAHATRASMEYSHPYFQARTVKRAGLIVVATDRGLCGGLNINLFKLVLKKIRAFQNDKVPVDLCVIGQKAESFFRRLHGINIISAANFSDGSSTISAITGSISVMISAFDNKEIDALYLFSNQFVNTIKQKPHADQLLPISLPEVDSEKSQGQWDYIYEPGAKRVLDVLLVRYIESQVYSSVVENLACEQAARMLAMKNATDNAGEIIDSLKLKFNKARQAMITQELSEIVSGAAAV
ncbi:MAG: F0F1 ATP synthase subunit gamma [Francisellaceae bacterium]